MPNKVSIETILMPLYRAHRNQPVDEVNVSFEDFSELLKEADVYTSASSIKTAWSRVRGSEYCTSKSIDGKTLVIDISDFRRRSLKGNTQRETHKAEAF